MRSKYDKGQAQLQSLKKAAKLEESEKKKRAEAQTRMEAENSKLKKENQVGTTFYMIKGFHFKKAWS